MKTLKLIVLVLAVSALASAMPIVGLYSTGLGTMGSAEPNWQVNGGTAFITQDGQYPIGPWVANDAGSQWISPQAAYGSGATDTPNATYTYTLTFDLTGYDHTTATFLYALAGDDYIDSILLNSTTLGGANSSFTSMSGPFLANTGFVAGLNTITVTLPNSDGLSGNPNGFRMEILSSDVQALNGEIPEPATFALVGLALAVLPVLRRRR